MIDEDFRMDQNIQQKPYIEVPAPQVEHEGNLIRDGINLAIDNVGPGAVAIVIIVGSLVMWKKFEEKWLK